MSKNFEVDISDVQIQDILAITDMPEYESFDRYLNMVLEKHRDKLEKDDDDKIRGECERLRRLLRLRKDLVVLK